MTVRRRIQMLHATVLVLVLSLIAFTYTSSRHLVADTHAFITDDLPALGRLGELKLNIMAQDQFLYAFFSTADAAALHRERDKLSRQITRDLADLQGRMADDTGFGDVHALLSQYARTVQRLEDSLAGPAVNRERARNILAEATALSIKTRARLNEVSSTFEQKVAGRARVASQRIDEMTQLVQLFSAILLLIAFAGGAAASTYMTESAERHRLAMFAERNPDPVLSLSPDGRVLYANPGTHHLLAAMGGDSDDPAALIPPNFLHWANSESRRQAGTERIEYQAYGRTLACRLHYLPDPGIVHAFITDITERKRAEDELRYQALFDALTGLPNRRSYEQHLTRLLGNNATALVMQLNIDRFRNLVESLGRATADEVLVQVGKRLDGALRGCTNQHIPGGLSAAAYRLEGDTFAVLGSGTADVDAIMNIAEGIRQEISRPLALPGRNIFLSFSVAVLFPARDGPDIATLSRNADAVIHHLKQSGGGRVSSYTPQMNAQVLDRLELEHDLHYALERHELELVFQPQASIGSGRIIGVETLLRWNHPQRGELSPACFVPIAEDTGLIVPIGTWVLREACRQAQAWRDDGIDLPVIAVNVSARQFTAGNFPELVRAALAESGLPATRLELEITESVAMNDVEHAVTTLQDLATLGVKLSIDDFGTGYSSLAYLRRFPIGKLKIDQSFVRYVSEQANASAIAAAVVNLASALDLTTIAEGVETIEQLNVLRALGCKEIQGYLFSRPLKVDPTTRFLRARSTLDIMAEASAPAS